MVEQEKGVGVGERQPGAGKRTSYGKPCPLKLPMCRGDAYHGA